MKKKVLLWVAVFALLPIGASAATIRSGDNYRLISGEAETGSLYVGAGSIDVAGTVGGDAVLSGGTVDVTGDVTGDILAGSGTMQLSGKVGGDVRVGGGQVTISGPVAGDVVVGGGSVKLTSAATVGGDVLAAGGTIEILGAVTGQIRAAGGSILIDAAVGGPVSVMADEVRLGARAALAGDFSYKAEKEAQIDAGATVVGKTTFTESHNNFRGYIPGLFGLALAGWLMKLVTVLVAAVLILLITKSASRMVVNRGTRQFWPSVLIGFIVMVATPIACLFLMMTVIGAFMGVIALFAYIVLLMLGWVFSGIILGAWLFHWIQKTDTFRVDWVSAIVGVLVIQAVALIPFVGWLAEFIFMLAGLGAAATVKWRFLRDKPQV